MDTTIESGTSINEAITTLVKYYLNEYGSDAKNIHSMLMEVIEQPLLDTVMQHCKYNQVRAAKLLGISRGNLRKKLITHFDDKYCLTRK